MALLQGQQLFTVAPGDFVTSEAGGVAEWAILLPKGAIWKIDTFWVTAQTNYAAQGTNYEVWNLTDSSGNTIATISNASTGVAIGPVTTGTDTSMVAAYQYIDCSDAEAVLLVKTAETGAGRVMSGVQCYVLATPQRRV